MRDRSLKRTLWKRTQWQFFDDEVFEEEFELDKKNVMMKDIRLKELNGEIDKLKEKYEAMKEKLSQEAEGLRHELQVKNRLLEGLESERKAAENEANKQKGAAKGQVTYTEEELKEALKAVADKTAALRNDEVKKCIIEYEEKLARLREQNVEGEKRLTKLQGEQKVTERRWAERMQALEAELAKRKGAQGGASRIRQLEAKVRKLEAENMAMECEIGEMLEMMSMNDTEDENEDDFSFDEKSDSEAGDEEEKGEDEGEEGGKKDRKEEEDGMKEKEKEEKKPKKKYSWDAEKSRRQRTRRWKASMFGEEDNDLND